MTFNEYQKLSERTISKKLRMKEKILHSLFGMTAEIGELHGIFQKVYQGHVADETHMKKEIGDLLWFIAEFCTTNGWKFDEIAEMNVDKLKARYPEGFEEERSLHRVAGDI